MPRGLVFLGARMDQEWQDIHIWENFFLDYPVKTFIELGTGSGGLSTYFALQCYQLGIAFHTFDHQRWLDIERPIPRLLNMQASYHIQDIFGDQSTVAETLRDAARPLALFCDDGNKPREWATFAPYTLPGDFLIVHDWETEFFPANLGDTKVERILETLCDARGPGWKSMWFKRI